MKVIKFGGTSVGSVQALLQLKRIVEKQAEKPVVIVVSAVAGMTDFLIKTARTAAEGDSNYLNYLAEMKKKHFSLVEGAFAPEQQKKVREELLGIFDELGNIFQGVALIRELSDKSEDVIVSYGERLSSLMVSRLLDIPLYDARKLIKTDHKFGKHVVNFEETSAAIKTQLNRLPELSVIGGFISSDVESGEITNIGRGGSDYTAAILASELNASILEIWTDVDGFMTADPKVINNAYVIENLSYVEAMELSNFGAKVIYPPTIFPVYHKNVPIRIKNTFNPEAPGTYISRDKVLGENKAIKGISSIPDTSLITIQGLGMVGVIGVNYRIFKTLAKAGISVFLVSQASSENTTSIGVRNSDAEITVRVLREEFNHEIEMGEINDIFAESNLATVAIVGEGMKRTPGIAGKLFTTLGRNGINVIACAQGASETNISFVIKLDHLRKSLNVIHDSFFLSEYQVLNLFVIGIGTVGGSLLEQIKRQQPKLMAENGLKLNVVGIADIEKAVFSREGIDLEHYKDLLKREGKTSSPELLRNEILGMNIFNSVFVDCTASPEISALYADLLSHNVSVVAANKIAASSDYDNYARLKELARRKGVKYLFETNVGAGLPIINTMNSLIHSGDRILKMEAVLSGTLNFIFNTISAENPLSKTIKMAQEKRFSEPDPRIDLSGTDVIRKLVILAREAGYRVEQEDVVKNLFIPDKYFKGSLEDFWKNIPEMDADFEAKRKLLEKDSLRWRFVAKMENGACSVGLHEVGPSHPFYDLEGSNNIILIQTERYFQDPMVIKGYGAGAGVTAAGVFGDIISIANIR
ncbi:MAG TPA: bifunctional aspartate kinase/homoserine dehydrogenase I [Bacteroidales bacterium]|nr:bifunctional aspartate kinase/homoserine dehydrogenase I [Bacteroidales bacterium]